MIPRDAYSPFRFHCSFAVQILCATPFYIQHSCQQFQHPKVNGSVRQIWPERLKPSMQWILLFGPFPCQSQYFASIPCKTEWQQKFLLFRSQYKSKILQFFVTSSAWCLFFLHVYSWASKSLNLFIAIGKVFAFVKYHFTSYDEKLFRSPLFSHLRELVFAPRLRHSPWPWTDKVTFSFWTG